MSYVHKNIHAANEALFMQELANAGYVVDGKVAQHDVKRDVFINVIGEYSIYTPPSEGWQETHVDITIVLEEAKILVQECLDQYPYAQEEYLYVPQEEWQEGTEKFGIEYEAMLLAQKELDDHNATYDGYSELIEGHTATLSHQAGYVTGLEHMVTDREPAEIPWLDAAHGMTLDEARAHIKAQAAEYRYNLLQVKGVIVNGVSIATDAHSVTEMSKYTVKKMINDLTHVDWKLKDGSFYEFTIQEVANMYNSVMTFQAQCFTAEKQIGIDADARDDPIKDISIPSYFPNNVLDINHH